MQKIEDLERQLLFNPAMKDEDKDFYLKGLVRQF